MQEKVTENIKKKDLYRMKCDLTHKFYFLQLTTVLKNFNQYQILKYTELKHENKTNYFATVKREEFIIPYRNR